MAKTKNYSRGKKRSAAIQTMRHDKETGKITRGIFLQIRPLITEAGEPVQGNFDQDLYVMEMADLDTGEVNQFWADGGVRGAIKLAKVAADTPIEVEHTGETTFTTDDGKQAKVQTYDVFELKSE